MIWLRSVADFGLGECGRNFDILGMLALRKVIQLDAELRRREAGRGDWRRDLRC